MRKSLLIISTALVAVLMCACFIACTKDSLENQINTSTTPEIISEQATGVKLIIHNEDMTSFQEVTITTNTKQYDFTYDEVKNENEGVLSLLGKKDIDYNYSGTVLRACGDISLSTQDLASGHRIIVFTTVALDQATTDTAKTLKVGNNVLKQTDKAIDELTFEDGCCILVTKVIV